jgi:outer membrane protein assembly factor BamC
VLALAAALAACSSLEGMLGGDKVDYRTTQPKTQPLEVPPDLTQLARDTRYQPQGGVISASATGAPSGPAATAAAASAPAVAAPLREGFHVLRDGQQRWLSVPLSPEQVWPQLKTFWDQRGFVLAEENAPAGVMATDWAENRSKLPDDALRNVLGRVFARVYDTGERDRYRTRVERVAGGSEIYITHQGIEEVYVGERRESTSWQKRPNDPQLEAEMLSRLLVALGGAAEPAARAEIASAAAAPARAAAAAQPATLVVEEPFDRAWRRVGIALDRGGFTVEDRDRAGGLYYVRWVDPKNVGKEEPGWWAKLLGDSSNPQAALRYRVALKASGDKTTVAIQSSSGVPETGDNAQRIVALLIKELR